MFRVLILPRHSPRAASCRQRFTQFLPNLAQRGVECTIQPFFDDVYTRALLTGGRKSWWRFGQSVARRVRRLLDARRYDLVVIHFELIPYLPAALEGTLARLAVPYVVDFDDAFFHRYGMHRFGIVRRFLGGKLGTLMKGAAMNVAGSEYLAAYARRFSPNVVVIPTAVDLERYPEVPPPRVPGPFRIGWIGSPTTTPHLRAIAGELGAFCAEHDAEVVAIGASRFDAGSLPVRWIDWSDSTEVSELSNVDVGIMPLPDTPFASGKCGFKLIQSMACWRPVVASPVGANRDIVEQGGCGLLAAQGEWGAALHRLHMDPGLRTRFGIAGRRHVEAKYSMRVCAPMVYEAWKGAARNGRLSSHM